MHAFVTGATGYTGRHVVEQLLSGGHTAVAHIRPDSRSLDTWGPRFEGMGARVDTSAWELDALTATLASHAPSHVYALLGTTAARQKSLEPNATYERVDRDLSLMLLQAASASEVGPTFVYLSSLGADKPRGNRYLQARFDVECALRDGDLPWLSARPSFITGPDRDEDRLAERLGATVTDAALAALGLFGARQLRDRYSSPTGRELATSLVAVAQDPTLRNTVVQTDGLRHYLAGHSEGANEP